MIKYVVVVVGIAQFVLYRTVAHEPGFLDDSLFDNIIYHTDLRYQFIYIYIYLYHIIYSYTEYLMMVIGHTVYRDGNLWKHRSCHWTFLSINDVVDRLENSRIYQVIRICDSSTPAPPPINSIKTKKKLKHFPLKKILATLLTQNEIIIFPYASETLSQ